MYRAWRWGRGWMGYLVVPVSLLLPACALPTPAAEAPASAPLPIAAPLQQVVQHMHQDGVTAANVASRQPATYSTPLVHVDTWGRIHTIILVTAVEAQVEAALTAHGVVIEHAEAQLHLVQGWVPFDRLTTIAALPFVRFLRPPSYASRR